MRHHLDKGSRRMLGWTLLGSRLLSDTTVLRKSLPENYFFVIRGDFLHSTSFGKENVKECCMTYTNSAGEKKDNVNLFGCESNFACKRVILDILLIGNEKGT